MIPEAPRPHRMTNREADTLLSLASGDERVFPVLFLMCGLPYKRKGEVFRYMIKKGIVGNHLVEVYERNQRSPFKLYQAICNKIDGHMATPLNVKDLL